ALRTARAGVALRALRTGRTGVALVALRALRTARAGVALRALRTARAGVALGALCTDRAGRASRTRGALLAVQHLAGVERQIGERDGALLDLLGRSDHVLLGSECAGGDREHCDERGDQGECFSHVRLSLVPRPSISANEARGGIRPGLLTRLSRETTVALGLRSDNDTKVLVPGAEAPRNVDSARRAVPWASTTPCASRCGASSRRRALGTSRSSPRPRASASWTARPFPPPWHTAR